MRSFFLLDKGGRVFTVKEKILYFLTAAFFITLFLPDMPVLNNIVVGAILVHCLFYNTFSEKRKWLVQRKGIGFMILFYGIHILSALLSNNRTEGMSLLVLRVPLLVFPLSIGLIVIRPVLKDRILLMFSTVTTITALVCLTYAFFQYRRFHDVGYLYNDSLTAVIRRQAIYFAMVVNLALFSTVYLLLKPSFTIHYTGLAIFAILFLLVFHFMLASRIAIVILYSSLILFAAFHTMRRRKYLEGSVLILGLLIGAVLLVKFFPKTLNRFRELEYTGYTYDSHAMESHYNMALTADQWNGANIRLAVWRCAWELFEQHWLGGVGLGDKQDRLTDIYRARHFDLAVRTRRNTHNTYLDILCCFGIIGLIAFLAGWLVFPLIACSRSGDWLGPFIILAFAASMITENYFDRSIGCLLAAFFFCFVTAYHDTEAKYPANRRDISPVYPG